MAAPAPALLLLASACGSPTEDPQGRLGDWTRGTRHVAALNSTEPIFYTRAPGGERLVLNCGGLSRSRPVAMMIEAAPGRPLGPAPGYERANDRSVDYRGEAVGGTMRGNVRADTLSFYADGPGHQGEALPRLADSAPLRVRIQRRVPQTADPRLRDPARGRRDRPAARSLPGDARIQADPALIRWEDGRASTPAARRVS